MSYDLYLTGNVTQAQFNDYFGPRRCYKLQDRQAWYENEETGVYFAFVFAERADNSAPISFNMNYYRPHTFGLEAGPEVAALVNRFGLTVSDPQASGMGEGAYSTDGFLRGWNAGNEFGYRALAARALAAPVFSLPASRIESCWRWNYEREERNEDLDADAFIPRIMFLDGGGKALTAAVWGDGIPILLPEVDWLLVPRQELAPAGSPDDIVVITWDEVAALVKRYPKAAGSMAAYELFYETPPADLVAMIRSKKPPTTRPTLVRPDHVLDVELLTTAHRGK